MPLTLSLYGSSNYSGQLIIDRNNLINAYPDPIDEKKIFEMEEIRGKVNEAIYQAILSSLEKFGDINNSKSFFAMTDDPRHDALGHMGAYDRYHTMHAHYNFPK